MEIDLNSGRLYPSQEPARWPVPSGWFLPHEGRRVLAAIAEGMCPFLTSEVLRRTVMCRNCGTLKPDGTCPGCTAQWSLVPHDGWSLLWVNGERTTRIYGYPYACGASQIWI